MSLLREGSEAGREGWTKERRALEVVQFVSTDNATGHFGESITGIQWKDHGLLRWGLILLFHFFSFPQTKAIAGNGGFGDGSVESSGLGCRPVGRTVRAYHTYSTHP